MFANSVGSDTKNNVDMIKQSRSSLDEMNQMYFNGTKTVYMYGYPFLFNEQYLHSLHDLYMVVGFALGKKNLPKPCLTEKDSSFQRIFESQVYYLYGMQNRNFKTNLL